MGLTVKTGKKKIQKQIRLSEKINLKSSKTLELLNEGILESREKDYGLLSSRHFSTLLNTTDSVTPLKYFANLRPKQAPIHIYRLLTTST